MKNIVSLLIILIISSCSQNDQDTTHEWIQENNDNFLIQIGLTVEGLGSRSTDVSIQEKAEKLDESIDEIIDKSNDLSFEEIDSQVTALIKELDLPFQPVYLDQQTWQKNKSKSQARTQIALLGTEILEYYRTRLGLLEVIFNHMQVVFVPDEIVVPRNGTLKGKLLVVGVSNNLENCCALSVERDSIEIVSGEGIVNISWDQLKGKTELNTILETGVNNYSGKIKYRITE